VFRRALLDSHASNEAASLSWRALSAGLPVKPSFGVARNSSWYLPRASTVKTCRNIDSARGMWNLLVTMSTYNNKRDNALNEVTDDSIWRVHEVGGTETHPPEATRFADHAAGEVGIADSVQRPIVFKDSRCSANMSPTVNTPNSHSTAQQTQEKSR